ncbi:dephospho-CoA kinase [Jannaschia pohangensis]|uniref:Dephospho-CoA kinase n=1 Tax=Jannaschia pohangensis TaxID=390807 RepID=A0A1I3TFZ4_9RHOB|nr:dephospho-CoA kinase [Jannaschia pohangensis]SFJ69413.1 dephospho-CoA kinase [Jannaschia pohangensis]
MILGLTGSIGMGKSTTAAMFAEQGIPVWDADDVVRRLYAPGGPALDLLEAAFPGCVGENGVDRDVLRALVAKDPGVLDQLNALIHPLVAGDRAEFLRNKSGLVVLDVPLLFETGADAICDRIAVVSVDAETQRTRVLARGTMSEADFDAILSRQLPDAEKRARADYVIDTSTMETARDMVATIIEELT